jgi:hypothetical protein
MYLHEIPALRCRLAGFLIGFTSSLSSWFSAAILPSSWTTSKCFTLRQLRCGAAMLPILQPRSSFLHAAPNFAIVAFTLREGVRSLSLQDTL